MITVDFETEAIVVTQRDEGVDIVRQGRAGPAAVSSDAGNHAVLGSDSLVYVPDSHSGLADLDADVHPQYLTALRGDARYSLGDHTHADAAKVTVSATKPLSPEVGEFWVPEG